MSKKTQERRELLKTNAIDPKTGKEMEVIFSHAKIQSLTKHGNISYIYDVELVYDVLKKPEGIFEGLRQDDDEKFTDFPGWLCYSGKPSYRYNKHGKKEIASPEEVFLVFVNSEKVIYNWYWYSCDPANKGYPLDYKTRFRDKTL